MQHRGLGWALFVAYSYYMIQFHGIQNLPVDEVGTVSTLGTHMGYSGYSHRVLRVLTEGTRHDPVPRFKTCPSSTTVGWTHARTHAPMRTHTPKHARTRMRKRQSDGFMPMD